MKSRRKVIAGVYMITCLKNQKCYIGSSGNIGIRWDNHKYALRSMTHPNKYLQEDWMLYGDEEFSMSILQNLPVGLTKIEYEKYEVIWIERFSSNKIEKGYNIFKPKEGLVKGDEFNDRFIVDGKIGGKSPVPCICINSVTGDTVRVESYKEVSTLTGIPLKKVYDFVSYWTGKGKRSHNGWMVVREEDYDESVDYLTFNKRKKLTTPKTWRDYEAGRKTPRYVKKAPEDRNIKRCPIIAECVETGKQTSFPSLKNAAETFVLTKIRKCIEAPFKKYKHRGHYFRRDVPLLP